MRASLTRTSQKGGLIEFTKTLSSGSGTIVVPELIGKSGVAMLGIDGVGTNAVFCFVYVNASSKQGRTTNGAVIYDPLFDSETGTLTLNSSVEGTYLFQAW